MAVVSELGETWNTTAGNKTVTATPAVNDLIIVVAGASGMAGADDISVADDQSGVYTRGPRSTGGGTTGMMDIWVRNSLVSSAVSTVYTATISGDTGGGLTVLKVTAMSRTGSSAIRQQAAESTQTESPVVCTFPAAPLTGNPCIAGVFGEDNPAALTQPASWTETTDTGWATPASGVHVTFRSSGETSAAITWAGGAFTDHNESMIELDTSAAPSGNPSNLIIAVGI